MRCSAFSTGISTAAAILSITLVCVAQDTEKKTFVSKPFTSKTAGQKDMPSSLQAPRNSSSFWDDVEIGTRVTYFTLRDDKRDVNAVRASEGSFHGSITELDAKQNYLPLKLFVDYKMTPYWGFDLTWDEVQADTITRSDGHNDGRIDLKGPIVSVFGRYPNASLVTPYAGVGLAYFFGNFTEDYRWQYAINDDGSYKNGPSWSQTMSMENSIGWLIYAGAAIEIAENWNADLFVRYTKVEVNGTHTTYLGDSATSSADMTFPMSNTSVGLGVRYIIKQ